MHDASGWSQCERPGLQGAGSGRGGRCRGGGEHRLQFGPPLDLPPDVPVPAKRCGKAQPGIGLLSAVVSAPLQSQSQIVLLGTQPLESLALIGAA